MQSGQTAAPCRGVVWQPRHGGAGAHSSQGVRHAACTRNAGRAALVRGGPLCCRAQASPLQPSAPRVTIPCTCDGCGPATTGSPGSCQSHPCERCVGCCPPPGAG
jgi:hypothetical protein